MPLLWSISQVGLLVKLGLQDFDAAHLAHALLVGAVLAVHAVLLALPFALLALLAERVELARAPR